MRPARNKKPQQQRGILRRSISGITNTAGSLYSGTTGYLGAIGGGLYNGAGSVFNALVGGVRSTGSYAAGAAGANYALNFARGAAGNAARARAYIPAAPALGAYIPAAPPIGAYIAGFFKRLFGGVPVAPSNPYFVSITTPYSGVPGKGSKMRLTKKEKDALSGLYCK